MPHVRLLGTLALLTVLGACDGSRAPGQGSLQLPDVAPLETTEGDAFEVSLGATGGTPPLHYTLETLPPGCLFFTSTGLLRGPASAAGAYSLTVTVTDAKGAETTRTYPLVVHPVFSVSTAPLPTATQGGAYGFQLQAQGGQPPMTWTLVDGALPSGLSLGEDGQLTGVPGQQGTYTFTVRVQDAHGAQATKLLDLDVFVGGDGAAALPFSAANWNLDWFGDPTQGPTDDALQLDNVQKVMATTGADLWALEEVVDSTEFNALKQRLPGYDGFIANDPRVASGSSYYSASEQKVALLYRSDVVTVRDARLILTAYDYDFGTRPPLRVDLTLTRNGVSVDLVAIVLHMKALSDSASYDRRKSAALELKQYLDSALPTEKVLVLGDWNDDVDVSICWSSATSSYLPTPYQNFLDDPADYTFITRPLTLANQGSTVSYGQFIDHQLVSNELLPGYVNNSTRVLRPDSYISSYKATTTDHYPVFSRFAFAGP